MIDGPSGMPEKDEYFVTRQALTAKSLAAEYGFGYIALDHPKKWKNQLKDFFEFDGETKILEVETDAGMNKDVFERFKKQIKAGYK